MANYGWSSGAELYHYGIPGQKWGQRRYQNPDGSLTAEGRARYGRIAERHYRAGRALNSYASKHKGTALGNAAAKAGKRQVQIGNSYRNSKSQNKRDRNMQTALKVGAAVAGTALAAYGTYRLAKGSKNRDLNNMSTRAKIAFGSKLNAGDKLRVAGWKTRAAANNLGRSVSKGAKKLPGAVKGAASSVSSKIASNNARRANNRALNNMSTRSKIAFGSKLNAGDKLRVAGWKTRAAANNLGRSVSKGAKKLPGAVKGAASSVSSKIASNNARRANNRALNNMSTRSKIAFGSKLNAGDKLRVAGWKTRAAANNLGRSVSKGARNAGYAVLGATAKRRRK